MGQSHSSHFQSIPNQCSKMKILGITYESRMTWNTEIDNRCKKASQRLYVLRQLKPSLSKADLLVLYNGYIRSVLEYCGPIFIGASKRNQTLLDKVQRRAHRIVCGKSCICNSFQSLEERRQSQALKCFLAMRKKTHVLHNLFPRFLPSGRRLSCPVCRTGRRAKSFVPMCTFLYNKCHLNI